MESDRIILKRARGPWIVLLALVVLGLRVTVAAEEVRITLFHVNDVYEITPLGNGTIGGLARVGTLVRQLRSAPEQYGTVITLWAGDAWSPSALGTALLNPMDDSTDPRSRRFAGAQMVAAMNTLIEGKPLIEYAVFGNHEFDLSRSDFEQRLTDSHTRWFSANVSVGHPRASDHHVIEVPTAEGASAVRVGLIGSTIDSNRNKWVTYISTPTDAAVASATGLREGGRSSVDILIGLTHLSLSDDRAVAGRAPQIDLILGGHEHERHYAAPPLGETCTGLPANGLPRRGSLEQPIRCLRDNRRYRTDHAVSAGAPERTPPPIFKADANAKSAWVHRLRFDTDTRELRTESTLWELGPQVALDPDVEKVTREWYQRATDSFARQTPPFQIDRVVAETAVPLDGREVCVRGTTSSPSPACSPALLDMIGDSLACGAGRSVDLTMFNGGSVRVDDIVAEGALDGSPAPVTQLDVLRILPYGGEVKTVEIKGDRLAEILTVGKTTCVGAGCFLQTENVSGSARDGWRVGGGPFASSTPEFRDRWFVVALNDYLLAGGERGLGGLLRAPDPGNPGDPQHVALRDVRSTGRDIRTMLNERLAGACPAWPTSSSLDGPEAVPPSSGQSR